MAAPYITPHQAIVDILRRSGLTTVGVPNGPTREYNWVNPDGSPGSPYYIDAKEPQPDFPYVTYDLPDSEGPQHTMGDSYPEIFKPEFKVYGVNPWIHYLGSPYGSPINSLFAFLDSLAEQPFVFNGVRYICTKFIRLSWVISEEDVRAPDNQTGDIAPVYNNVYAAKATYEMEIAGVYPTFQYSQQLQ